MLSRVADSVYWMARYVERAENVARFVDVNLQLNLDLPENSPGQWMSVVSTAGDDASFLQRFGEPTRENVIEFQTFDRENPNSIVSCLKSARENARSVREIISSEMWVQLNTFYLRLMADDARHRALESPHEFFAAIRTDSHLFWGMAAGTMSHNEAWHFTRLGDMLERADKATRIVDVKYYLLSPDRSHVSTIDDIEWSAVLKSCSGFEMYRKRHGRIAPEWVVEFLLLDAEFPRSVAFCIHEADDSLHAITGTPAGTFRCKAEQQLGQVRAELAYAQVGDILREGLHECLDDLQQRLNGISGEIHSQFFEGSPVAV